MVIIHSLVHNSHCHRIVPEHFICVPGLLQLYVDPSSKTVKSGIAIMPLELVIRIVHGD